MRKAFSFLIGVTVGGLVGGIVAILFAPASGNELRAMVGNRFNAFTTDVRQAAATKRIELQERLEVMRAPKE